MNYNDEVVIKVLRAYKEGIPIKKISEEYGMCDITIFNWVDKAKLKRRGSSGHNVRTTWDAILKEV
jgi:transposase-like protein